MTEPSRKSVYIAGALTDMTTGQRIALREFYEQIAVICRQFNLDPFLPHKHADPEHMMELTPAQVDRIDRLAVTQSYLVIAYVGVPSIGIGIEVEMAHHANKPVVIMAEHQKLETRRVTRLVRGNPAVIAEIGFRDFEDAKIELHRFLQSFTAEIAEEELPIPLRITSR